MKFLEYLQKTSESSASKRAVIGRYGNLYPPQYALTYRLQYNPNGIFSAPLKKSKRRKR